MKEQHKKMQKKIAKKRYKRGRKKEDQKKTESDKDKKKKDPSIVHAGSFAQLPPKTEKTGICLITQLYAQIYCEQCNLMGVGIEEVDFTYDTGTVSDMGEERKF
jgi:hypothetical protein